MSKLSRFTVAMKVNPATWLTVLWVACGALVGCDHGVYEVELTPQGDAMHREITLWREQTREETTTIVSVPEGELAAVSRAYESAVPDLAPRKYNFDAEFRRDMPIDVGGSGWYVPFTSPAGTLYAYTERFRGTDDLALDLDQRLAALERLVDLLSAMLREELGTDPEVAPLHEFVQNELRRDLKNLCLYVWAFGIVGHYQELADEELGVRAAQYLIERSYITPESMPELTRVFGGALEDEYSRLLKLLQRVIARKMGVADEQPVPDFLAEFLSEDRLSEAFARIGQNTEEYRQSLAEWEAQKQEQDNPDLERPEPGDVFTDLLAEAFLPGFTLFGGSDSLTVTLKLPHEPFMTNGTWDEAAGSVTWSESLVGRNSDQLELPAVLYAFWAQPDEAYQKKHFGQPPLQNEELAEFCLWHRGLPRKQAEQWDEFVSSLQPGDDLGDRIKRFAFDGERPVEDVESPPPSEADVAKALLLQALTGEIWPPEAEPEAPIPSEPGSEEAPAPPPPAPES